VPKQVAPYGRWESPINAEQVAQRTIAYDDVRLDGEAVYWLESRPQEEGRTALVRWTPDAGHTDVLPPGFDVGSRVHEYGGGAYFVGGRVLIASNLDDGRLYRVTGNRVITPITPEASPPGSLRYADLRVVEGGELLVCVRERYEPGGVINELVCLPVDGSADPWIIAGGHDFYSFPRPSPDGRQLAWTTWDHPRMPWDGTDLWVADLRADGRLGDPRHVAGGPTESIFQPEWSPGGELFFVSDRSGWWNLYRERGSGIEPFVLMEAEFGEAQWEFDYSTYAFVDSGRITCRYRSGGLDHLALIDLETGELEDLDLPFTSLKPYVRGSVDRVAFIGSSASRPSAVAVTSSTGEELNVLAGGDTGIDDAWVSHPTFVDFPTEGGVRAHAIYYPPTSGDSTGPEGKAPPLIVEAHEGPTADAKPRLELRTQFFTSRGFAVAHVNYRGSTGYGRAYRDSLNRLWGLAEVADCINAARYFANSGLVDARRTVIVGASAGGFTALCALARAGSFAAGGSYYGITDLETFAREAPKFQSHYVDQLVGPYPEAVAEYRARSPLHFADRLAAPVILVAGCEDRVVPRGQIESMVKKLERAGIKHVWLAFEDEGHRLRRPGNIEEALENELSFYLTWIPSTLAD
jgi:dipeptidyl aminopeptidase/acylaminoacyl peptidase